MNKTHKKIIIRGPIPGVPKPFNYDSLWLDSVEQLPQIGDVLSIGKSLYKVEDIRIDIASEIMTHLFPEDCLFPEDLEPDDDNSEKWLVTVQPYLGKLQPSLVFWPDGDV